MNERIRELAAQAGFNPYNYMGGNTGLFEKFAELIVKECARIVPNTDLSDVDGSDSAVLRAASQQLKEHFGVE